MSENTAPEAQEDLAAKIVRVLWDVPAAKTRQQAEELVRACLAGSAQLSEQKKDTAMRVDGVASDRPLGSTASGNGVITADDLDNLRHMLGVSDRCREGYRNYFVAGVSDVESMERLRGVRFVVKNESYAASSEPCYHATAEGARAVGLKALPR